MTTFAGKTKIEETGRSRSTRTRKSEKFQTEPVSQSIPIFGFPIQRKAGCACGGGCPTCQAKDSNLPVSQPTDASEIEADRVADKVMRMSEKETLPFRQNQSQAQPLLETISPMVQTKSQDDSSVSGGLSNKIAESDALQIQTKLAVSTPGDQYEQEADRVAEHVMRMPESMLRRDEPRIQRQANGEAGTGEVASDFTSRLGTGMPLDSASRVYFEPRFNWDFQHVRLHIDANAAESARAVKARAYTIGRDIVFGTGEYAPETNLGRRLLAHELTHVIQQSPNATVRRSGSSPNVPGHKLTRQVNHAESSKINRRTSGVLQRQAGTTTPEVTVTGPNACSLAQHHVIAPAVDRAQQWLTRAIGEMHAHLNPITTNPDFAVNWPWDTAVLGAMRRHFNTTDRATVMQVYQRIVTINNDLTGRRDLHVECHGAADQLCGSAAAYVNPGNLVFCPSFFTGGAQWQSEALVHEMAHTLVGGPHITDRAYSADRLYRTLPTAEALINAESYGLLVLELGTRRAQESTAPTDSQQHCPDDWQPLLRAATARAQRWNRNALTSVDDRRSAWLTGWLDLQTTHLGVTTAAGTDPTTNAALITALNNARAVYHRVQTGLQSGLNFACEVRADGRCATFFTYWDGAPPSPLHLCPTWRNLAAENDRIYRLLVDIYGYLGGLPDAQQAQRVNYAGLARDLTTRFWP
jgi:hypothetical protein